MEAATAIPGDAHAATIDPRLRHVGCEIDIVLGIRRAQLVQDEARAVFIKTAEHPIGTFHCFKRLGCHQTRSQRDHVNIGVDFANEAFRDSHLRTTWHGIIMARSDKPIATCLIEFIIIDQGHLTDTEQGEVLGYRATKATNPDESDPRSPQLPLTFLAKQPDIPIVSPRERSSPPSQRKIGRPEETLANNKPVKPTRHFWSVQPDQRIETG